MMANARRRVSLVCERCSGSFAAYPCQLRRGQGRYCSVACRNAARVIPLESRFWAKVDKSGECWMWVGACGPKGYGSVGSGGHRGKTVYAHRLAWELTRGPIPRGLVIDHLCRIRRCVNPDHLETVRQRTNVIRGFQHRRAMAGAVPEPAPTAAPAGRGERAQ